MMAVVRNDDSIVRIWDSQNKTWKELSCGKIKVERKQDMNTRTACNSKDPYEVNPGAQEWTLEIPDVALKHQTYFNWVMERQAGKAPLGISVAEYMYNSKGKLERQWLLQHVYFESMSQEGNDAFDMKGAALSGKK